MSSRKTNTEPKGAIPREMRQPGDLVAPAGDMAARDSDDRSEVSRVAADAVMHLLERARTTSTAPKLLLPPQAEIGRTRP